VRQRMERQRDRPSLGRGRLMPAWAWGVLAVLFILSLAEFVVSWWLLGAVVD